MKWYQILPLILATVFAFAVAIAGTLANSEVKKLAEAFKQLGNIQGMPIADIIAVVGEPSGVSSKADGTAYQWMKVASGKSAHYVILVDDDKKAVGFSHQFLSG